MYRRRHTQSNETAQTHTKKKVIEYSERDDSKRSAYEAEISEVTAEKRYYIDECGINEYLYREYGYALRGVKVYGKVQGKKYERLSMVAARCGDDIIGRYEYKAWLRAKKKLISQRQKK